MEKKEIALNELHLDGIDLTNRYILVTAGTLEEGKFNSMTISWGFFGNMWFDPMALIAIRESRYTNEFLEAGEDFTLTILPEKYKSVYGLMGSKSGRNSNKMKESGLTPIASRCVKSPSYEEACFTLECRKVYMGDILKEGILDQKILERDYADGDYHRIYIGKIVRAWKTGEF